MIDSALKYDNLILNNKIKSNENIKLACKRDLHNREESKNKNYPYYFDLDIANKAVKLASLLTNHDLANFQKWIISVLTGWRYKNDKSMRRFNNSIISMARKNGKSFLSSALLLNEFILNTYDNQQLLIVANTFNQALLTLDQVKSGMRTLLKKSSYLRSCIKINSREIVNTKNGAFIRALPSDPKHLDSLGGSCNLDESHIYKDSKLKDVISSGMAQLKNGLLLQTSTVGFNFNGSFYNDYQIAKKVLKNKISDDRSFYVLYGLDDKKEINNTDNWIKANPLFEVESIKDVMLSNLKTQVKNATVNGSLNSVLTKNFNVWSKQENDSFIDIKKWKNNIIKQPNLMNRKNVVIGLDLAKRNDLASVVFTVPLENGKFYTYQFSFLSDSENIERKSQKDNINYQVMEKNHEVHICKNNYGLIDYDLIYKYVIDLVNKYQWKDVTIAYDPWGADFLILKFDNSDFDFNLVEVRQNRLSDTINFMRRLILSEKLKHSDSKIFDYAFNNLVANYSDLGNIYLSKSKAGNKIDPVFALLDTLKIVKEKVKKDNQRNNLINQLNNDSFTF